ncbi:MAG: hypothetical protein ACRD22_08000 [Terriglobia bacterium]
MITATTPAILKSIRAAYRVATSAERRAGLAIPQPKDAYPMDYYLPNGREIHVVDGMPGVWAQRADDNCWMWYSSARAALLDFHRRCS